MLRTQLVCLSFLLAFTQVSSAGPTSPQDSGGAAASSATSSSGPDCGDGGSSTPSPVANELLSNLPNNQTDLEINLPNIGRKTMQDAIITVSPE